MSYMITLKDKKNQQFKSEIKPNDKGELILELFGTEYLLEVEQLPKKVEHKK